MPSTVTLDRFVEHANSIDRLVQPGYKMFGNTEKRSWSAVACHRFGCAKNRNLRKRVAGMSGLIGAAKAVASHRTP